MPVYEVRMSIRDDFRLWVEAENEDEAYDLSLNMETDMWDLLNSETEHFEIVEAD